MSLILRHSSLFDAFIQSKIIVRTFPDYDRCLVRVRSPKCFDVNMLFGCSTIFETVAFSISIHQPQLSTFAIISQRFWVYTTNDSVIVFILTISPNHCINWNALKWMQRWETEMKRAREKKTRCIFEMKCVTPNIVLMWLNGFVDSALSSSSCAFKGDSTKSSLRASYTCFFSQKWEIMSMSYTFLAMVLLKINVN